MVHPVGNVAEFLVAAGLARIVDWHAGMLASGGAMERLRAAEKVAKEKRQCLYASLPPPSAAKPIGSPAANVQRNFDATVIRVWSGDQISVIEKDKSVEKRIQLSSTRAPRSVCPQWNSSVAADIRDLDKMTLSRRTMLSRPASSSGKS